MKKMSLSLTIVALFAWLSPSVDAGEVYSLFRYLGIGWGDGYHAYDGCKGYCNQGGYAGESFVPQTQPMQYRTGVPLQQPGPVMSMPPTNMTPAPSPTPNQAPLPAPASRSATYPRHPAWPMYSYPR